MTVERDVIELRGLRVHGRHGVYEHERREGQDFVIDATLELDTRRAARSDNVADTVDYGELAEDLARAVEETRFDLIEALADHLAQRVLRYGKVRTVRVRVAKPSAPMRVVVDEVAVVVTRP